MVSLVSAEEEAREAREGRYPLFSSSSMTEPGPLLPRIKTMLLHTSYSQMWPCDCILAHEIKVEETSVTQGA